MADTGIAIDTKIPSLAELSEDKFPARQPGAINH